MIHFKLRELEKIEPFGRKPEQQLHWFGLTDGDLWLTFGNETIYKYSKEAMDYWENKPTPYNDYYLSRFIEDFTKLFDKISETIPEIFYDLTQNLKEFHTEADKMLDLSETDEVSKCNFNFEEYEKLTSWLYDRTLDSGHLIGGPHLSFFRKNDKLRIVWDTEHRLDNGISLWAAKNGSLEMDYTDFVNTIKSFGRSFFVEMEKQVKLSIEKDWGQVMIDKQNLAMEHEKRKIDFDSSVELLEQASAPKTDWAEIEQMRNKLLKILRLRK